MKRLKLVIAGSRDFNDYETFKVILHGMLEASGIEPDFIVQGYARGVDKMALRWAEEVGLPHSDRDFEPMWRLHGRYMAPKIRNKKMANEADAAIIIMFAGSPGSSHMRRCMVELDKPVWVYTLPENFKSS